MREERGERRKDGEGDGGGLAGAGRGGGEFQELGEAPAGTRCGPDRGDQRGRRCRCSSGRGGGVGGPGCPADGRRVVEEPAPVPVGAPADQGDPADRALGEPPLPTDPDVHPAPPRLRTPTTPRPGQQPVRRTDRVARQRVRTVTVRASWRLGLGDLAGHAVSVHRSWRVLFAAVGKSAVETASFTGKSAAVAEHHFPSQMIWSERLAVDQRRADRLGRRAGRALGRSGPRKAFTARCRAGVRPGWSAYLGP